jgi:PAS domain S-box-containing protein
VKNAVERKTGHLAENGKLFQAIFEQAAIGVALVSTSSGKFLKINKKYCDIVGYSEEEMLNTGYEGTHNRDHIIFDG